MKSSSVRGVAYGKCRLYGNPLKNADSHRDLEKLSAFPHFPQALLVYISIVLIL